MKKRNLAAWAILLFLISFLPVTGQEKKPAAQSGSPDLAQTSAEILGLVSINDHLATISMQIGYQFPAAGTNIIAIDLPREVNLTKVQGRGIRAYELVPVENAQQLRIALSQPARGQWTLILAYEKIIPEQAGSFEFPFPELKGVKSYEAAFGLDASSNVEVRIAQSENIKQLDLSQLPDEIGKQTSSVILLGFAYSRLGEAGGKPALGFSLTRYQDVQVIDAIIDDARYLTLCLQDGFCITKAGFSVRNKSRQYLKVQLPKGAEIWSAFLVDSPVRPSRNADGDFLIPLTRSDAAMSGLEAFPIELVYTNASSAWGSVGRTALELPKLDLVVREMNWFMYLPKNYKYHRFAGLEMVAPPNARGGNELELKKALEAFEAPFQAPDFLRFQARARQVEAGRNLNAIYVGQAVQFENAGAYSQTFEEVGWAPKGDTRYSYYMGKDFAPPTALDESREKVKRVIRNTKAEARGFQTFAIGNIDGDPVPDIWRIDENKNMVNLINDVQLDELDDAAMRTLQELKAQGVIADIESVLKLPPVRVGPHASGILPIKLDIPQQGLLFQFHKLFPGEGQDKRPAKIAFWYMPNSVAKGFTGFSWLTLAAMLLIGIGSGVGFAKTPPENRNKLFRKTTLTLGMVLLAGVGIQFAGWGVLLIISMF